MKERGFKMTINLDMGHTLSGTDTGAVKKFERDKELNINGVVQYDLWIKLILIFCFKIISFQ